MGKQLPDSENKKLFTVIREIIEQARGVAVSQINSTICLSYFLIGRFIVEDEQQGHARAGYAEGVLKYLGKELTNLFGRGYSARNLANMKKFYLTYQFRVDEQILQTLSATALQKTEVDILQTLSAKFKKPFLLSWSHYLLLCRIENESERNFYEIEAVKNSWSLRELDRQFNSALFERLVLGRNKEKIRELAEVGHIVATPRDAIKDPLVLEFLGLQEDSSYSETDLETAIINKLEHFLLELGKGFLFVGRQVRISFEEEHFFIDLVFYNRLLKCFVVIDLKIGKLKHQDIGQMQMYVNYYDRHVKDDEENPTIGIIICKDKKDAVVEMTLPEENRQIFASRYQLYLPTKEEIKAIINQKNI